MELFIDESGNLGPKDRYFVIALFWPSNKKRIRNLARSFCAKNSLDEIKAARLSFPDKQDLIIKLSSVTDNTISYIVADKRKIQSQKLWSDKNLCFNYLFMHLVRNIVSQSGEDVNMLVDEHALKVSSQNSLQDYLRIKAYTEWGFIHELNIVFTDSRQSKLVQIADLCANAIYARYNYGKSHLYGLLPISQSLRFPHLDFGT